MFILILILVKLVFGFPAVRFAERKLSNIEGFLMTRLRQRLELVAPAQHETVNLGSPSESAHAPSLAAVMERTLRRSMDMTSSDSRRSLFARMLGELVPDEARIVSALSDGSTYPLIDIEIAQRGDAPQAVLKNASSVGRAAGVADPSLVPLYVTRLIALGLAETGPEDLGVDDEYQILLTDAMVQTARQEAAKRGRRAARVVRRTVRISPTGRDFWSACQATTEVT